MNIFTIFFTSLLVGLSGAVMPGPLLTINIYNTLRKGIKSGFSTIIGHSIIEAIIFVAILVGLKQFLSHKLTQVVIGILGGGTLIFMGINMIRAHKTINLELELSSSSVSKSNDILKGILATMSNPYWYIWWATIGLNYISISRRAGTYGPTAFYFGHISSDFVWYGLVAFLTAKGVKKMNQKIYKLLILMLGIFLIFLGTSFIVFGITLI